MTTRPALDLAAARAARPAAEPAGADESWALAAQCADLAWALRGREVAVLDVRAHTALVEYFVLATGTARAQVRAMAGEIARAAKADGTPPRGLEGVEEGLWTLLDLGGVVVHLFQPSVREHYDLELLWGEARAYRWQDEERPAPPPEPEPDDDPFAGFLTDWDVRLRAAPGGEVRSAPVRACPRIESGAGSELAEGASPEAPEPAPSPRGGAATNADAGGSPIRERVPDPED